MLFASAHFANVYVTVENKQRQRTTEKNNKAFTLTISIATETSTQLPKKSLKMSLF